MKKQLNLLLASGVLALLVSCAGPTSGNSEFNNDPPENYSVPGFIIDAHIHYRATDEWEKSFIETFTEYNAMGCVMVRMPDLERGIAFAKANPDRVIPYAMINIDSVTVLDDIRKAHAMGYKGLGELFAKNEWNYDDPKYDPVWALAEELKMPIGPHTGNLGSGEMARLRPSFLATIAVKFPNLYIVGGHFGNPWYAEAGEAARRNKNLYFDISGSSLIKKEGNPGIWREYLWWTPYVGKTTAHMPKDLVPAFEKLVFATDEGPDAFKENIRRFNRLLDANNVSAESREKIYGLTMAKIHGITPPAPKK
ncbi:MAG: amidohydrolase family protein [Chitinophagaceae bacterium]|nr:amidohydrolase family protein [Chitinophagaceae bacterium]